MEEIFKKHKEELEKKELEKKEYLINNKCQERFQKRIIKLASYTPSEKTQFSDTTINIPISLIKNGRDEEDEDELKKFQECYSKKSLKKYIQDSDFKNVDVFKHPTSYCRTTYYKGFSYVTIIPKKSLNEKFREFRRCF